MTTTYELWVDGYKVVDNVARQYLNDLAAPFLNNDIFKEIKFVRMEETKNEQTCRKCYEECKSQNGENNAKAES